MAILGTAPIRSVKDVWMRGGRTGGRLVVVALACLLAAVPLALRFGAFAAGDRDGGRYRYRFERPERGSVKRALEEEIAFHQARIRRDPTGGLDLAALSGTYLRMAKATGDLNWYLLAEQAARRSLDALPYQNSAALLILARVAEARHDFPEAIHLARLAGRTSEGLSVIVTSTLAQGHLDAAARAADTLVGTAPGLASYTLRALVAAAQGDDSLSAANFERALAAEEFGEAGSSAWTRTLLGRLHYRRGRLAEAAGLYEEALRILPEYPLALINLAELEMRQGRYRAAEHHLTQVVNLTRESPNVYDHAVLRGLARLHALRGDRRRAETLWADAERRLRRDVTTGQFGHRRELARLLLERGWPGDVDEAIRLTTADVRVRRDAETLEVHAWALARGARWTEARRVMQEALRGGGREARVFYRAATIEQALGHHTEAVRLLALMQDTDPTFDARARRLLGVEP